MMLRWGQAEDALRLAASIEFFWHFQDVENAKRVLASIQKQGDHQLLMTNPFSNAHETILSSIVGMLASFDRAAFPYDTQLKTWVRHLSVQSNGLTRTLHLLTEHDHAWTLEHLESLVTNSPSDGLPMLCVLLRDKSLTLPKKNALIQLVQSFPETDKADLARTLRVYT